jgi:hypothetical protein
MPNTYFRSTEATQNKNDVTDRFSDRDFMFFSVIPTVSKLFAIFVRYIMAELSVVLLAALLPTVATTKFTTPRKLMMKFLRLALGKV